MLFGHGSDAYKFDGRIIADFSSNVWYKGLPDGLAECLSAAMSKLVNYPEPDAGKLGQRIAEFHELSHEMVLPTNGASEAFYLIAQLFKNSESAIVYPSFAEYEDACRVHEHSLSIVSNSSINFNEKLPVNGLIWLGNPNNPDGKVQAKADLEAWIKLNPETTFVIDEAYGDLCCDFESMVGLLKDLPNLILVKSLTKTYVIPGLRLGYILAAPTLIKALLKIKIPWSVNSLAIEAGLFVLEKHQELAPNKELLQKESLGFQKALGALDGLKIYPSKCNYFLLELEHHKAADLKQYLVETQGLLIRDASNFRGLTEKHFRVALQSSAMNTKLVDALKSFLSNG